MQQKMNVLASINLSILDFKFAQKVYEVPLFTSINLSILDFKLNEIAAIDEALGL